MRFKKIFRILFNKYLLTALAFVIWTTFFDQNDWLSLRQRQKDLTAVQRNISYLNTDIDRMNQERTGLLTDRQKLEQYARENYRMKQDGEDIYVIGDTVAGK